MTLAAYQETAVRVKTPEGQKTELRLLFFRCFLSFILTLSSPSVSRDLVPERMNRMPPLRAICSLTFSDVLPIFVHLSPSTEMMMEARPMIRDMIIRALQAWR